MSEHEITLEEFLRMEKDVLDKYRVSQDIQADLQELQSLGTPEQVPQG